MAEEEKSFFNKMQEYLSTFGDRSDEVKEQDNPEQGVYAAPSVKQDNQVDYSKISYGTTLADAGFNIEAFTLPISAQDSDIKVAENDAGFPVFRSWDGSKYTVMPKQDQRTTLSRIKEDVIPAIDEYRKDPFLPTGEQVVGAAKSVAGSIYDTVSIPGDVLSGKKTDVTIGDLYNIAGTAGGMSTFGKAPAGSLRMFGGVGMNEAGTSKSFKRAKKLLKQSSKVDAENLVGGSIDFNTNKKIWEETNWYVDPNDGQWRFYIDDSKANLNSIEDIFKDNEITQSEIQGSKGSIKGGEDDKGLLTKLGDIFEHEELYKKYPFFKNLTVEFYDNPLSRELGTASDGVFGINLANQKNIDTIRSTVLHEMQHIIQMREGFVPGANAKNIPEDLVDKKQVLLDEQIKPLETTRDRLINEVNSTERTYNRKLEESKQPLTGLTADQEIEISKLRSQVTNYKIVGGLRTPITELTGPSWASIGKDYGVKPAQIQKAWGRQNQLNYLRKEIKKDNDNLLELQNKILLLEEKSFQTDFEFYRGAGGEIESRLVQKMADNTSATTETPVAPKFPIETRSAMLAEEGNKFEYQGKLGVDPLQYKNQPRRDPTNQTFLDRLRSKVNKQSVDNVETLPLKNLNSPEEILEVFHATPKDPFDRLDSEMSDLNKDGAFGPGDYFSIGSKYPSQFVGGKGTLLSAKVDVSRMLDARTGGGKPFTSNQTKGLIEALSSRKDLDGKNLNVELKDNKLSVSYLRKSLFAGESLTDRNVTQIILLNSPQDAFKKIKEITNNIKNPLERDANGYAIQRNDPVNTQNLKDILSESGFTGVIGVQEASSGGKSNLVIFDKSVYVDGGQLKTVINQGIIPEDILSAVEKNKNSRFAEGGSVNNMTRQMRMFEEGGIADDGMNRDPISGNEIPSGSLAKEVRDDIPAQLSEGEYVVPADVVRFFGVKYFEDLRMEAKQGLQTMEQNGRIGGEPTMSQAMPQGNQGSITDEDLAQIEQMFASGVANGGLMDKVAYVAANDPIINRAFNKGGAVVSFAVGGSVQSPFNDPTKVDAVIGKFMQMVQSKPQIMEELSKRGIQVTRTGANQQPQQIQRDNSASQTTEPVMEGKPAPTPEPVRAAEGSYIKSPTMELPPGFNRGYGVPGQSLTYTGPGVSPAVPDVAVAAPSTAGAAVPTTDVIPQCPPGQEYDPKTKMCVPRQDYDGSKKDDTEPTKPNYSGLAEKYGDVNFSDPDQFAKYLKDVSDPGSVGGLAKAGSIVGTLLNPALSVVSGVIGSGGQVNGLANIRAGLVIAQASGNADLIKAAEKAEADFIDSAGWIVKEGPGSFMASDASARAQAILNFGHGDALKMEGLDITDQENWSDSERERFANIFNVDTQTRRDALIKGSAAAEELKARQRADEAAQLAAFLADEQAQASSGIVASGTDSGGNSYTSVAQQVQGEYDLAKKNREAAKKAGVDDDYYVGNKGGLVTRPKKKKK